MIVTRKIGAHTYGLTMEPLTGIWAGQTNISFIHIEGDNKQKNMSNLWARDTADAVRAVAVFLTLKPKRKHRGRTPGRVNMAWIDQVHDAWDAARAEEAEEAKAERGE